jgi:hypothetical protein
MPDTLINFPLRGATQQELGSALGRCYREYLLWHGQSTLVASFMRDAMAAGVKTVMATRIRTGLDLAEAEGILITEGKTRINETVRDEIGNHQLATVDYGGKIAAIVMIHNACERFLWRLVRFGLVANRSKALTWIGDRKVTVKMLHEQPPEVLADDHLEKWWDELEREKLAKKWSSLVGLVGFPAKLDDGVWHFDQDMLSRFDEIRHNAVHHDGQPVKSFDFADFASQLERAQVVWLVHVARLLKLKIPAESMFSGS